MIADPVFSDTLPWVTSTPSSRSNPRLVTEASQAELPLLPPPAPVVPPPGPPNAAEVTMSSEETKRLACLKNLRDLGVDLPESLQQLAMSLEEKAKANTVTTISHSQITRLSRLRTQVSTISNKISAMDQQWSSFLNTVLNRVREHSEQYQACRADLIASLTAKSEELKAVKQSISQASRDLTLPEFEDLPPVDAPEFASMMQELLHFHAPVPPHVELLDDDNDEEVEEVDDAGMEEPEEEEKNANVRLRPTPHTSFRASPSPMRVANQNLKNKTSPKAPV